ncbi:MAG: hypothetical protein BIFFINMI_00735 [Phycisphaerae bacterium]|nr:hypothetical protein [Phycisphaerae bacterium]
MDGVSVVDRGGIRQLAWDDGGRALVDALYPREPWALSAHFAAIRAEGDVWQIGPDRPPAAAVRLVDTIVLAGAPSLPWSAWLKRNYLEPGYVVAPPSWSRLVESALPVRPRRFVLYRWPAGLTPPPMDPPPARRLTAEDLGGLQRLGEPWMWKHFGSAERLLRDSFAFGACDERGELVSVAAAFGWSHRFEDVAVATHPDHRRRGWATLCTRALVADTLGRGREPIWKSLSENRASRRVAEHVGFVFEREMTIYRVG